MNLKFIGGVLIVIGTCMGAGLLALPVSTAPGGFESSVFVMGGIWVIMSLAAFFILEVAQWFPTGTNLVSMAHGTLGKKGAFATWFLYLLLCYSLLCAYISGGSDVFHMLFSLVHIGIGQSFIAFIFVAIFGFIIYKGVKHLDYINRIFMIIKFSAFFTLIFFVLPYIKLPNLMSGDVHYVLSAVTVAITSFGFAIVIPSLLDYFNGDVKKVRIIIFCGTLIPLVCYVVWNFVIMGSLPLTGHDGLITILHSGNTTSGLVKSLRHTLKLKSITEVSSIFAAICILTSFLGVSLSLSDFIADGFKIQKNPMGKLKICALTFLPPLIVVIFYPKMFIVALSYAGIVVILLLALLPALMVWSGRYSIQIAKGYKVIGGRFSIGLVFTVGILLLVIGSLESFKLIL
jgi:tyrosine-specific transport protein